MARVQVDEGRDALLPEGFVERKEVQDNVVEYFASIDEAIQDFSIEELPREDEKDNSKSYKIDALYLYQHWLWWGLLTR